MAASVPADEGMAPVPRVPFPLQASERVLMLCRRHWTFLWPRTLIYVLAAVLPPALIAWAMAATDTYDGIAARIFWALSALWILYWGARALLNWYQYHHDIWVITNQRLVDSIKRTPFNHRIATADLVNVQDIMVERNGILPTMFNYGDIVCQTAAEGQDFRLSGVPRPHETQLLIDKERDRERMRRV
jgi:hypothetical protein